MGACDANVRPRLRCRSHGERCPPQIIEATATTEAERKPAFEAEFSPDLTHANVVQTFKASSVPITVRLTSGLAQP